MPFVLRAATSDLSFGIEQEISGQRVGGVTMLESIQIEAILKSDFEILPSFKAF